MLLSAKVSTIPCEPRDVSDHAIGRRRRHSRMVWILVLVTIAFIVGRSTHERLYLQSLPLQSEPKAFNHYPSRALGVSSLEVFEIYPPVLTSTAEGVLELTDGSSNASIDVIDDHIPVCHSELVSHSFANSYGNPYLHAFTPPECSFNRVTWNLSVTSAGRQFDRIAIVYLGDVEVFRTSTAEPTTSGIKWTYLKDMTPYLSLFKQPQTIIFDLGNIVNDIYTAPFNVTLTAAYFTARDSIEPADLVIPISSRRSTSQQSSVFTLPPDTASNNIKLPRNIQRAVVSISATGQIDEEFWWSNVPSSTTATFPQAGTLLGYSPFREVQLFIDGTLAGVAWPFPVIFTGGVVPGLWRPVVGIDAFDQKEDEIDITPWLPLLCDGNSHNFTIRVAGLVDDGKGHAELIEVVGSYWLVTGKIFIWLDADDHITTGQQISTIAPAPVLSVTSTTTTQERINQTLLYKVTARRSLAFSAIINTSQGSRLAYWTQSRTFDNAGNVTDDGNTQINTQHTSGIDVSASGYAKRFEYPLYAASTYATHLDNFSIVADITRGKEVQTLGRSVFPTGLESLLASSAVQELQGADLRTYQEGVATYLANTTSSKSFSFGQTAQNMSFSGVSIDIVSWTTYPPVSGSKELFTRDVLAINGTVIWDHEVLLDQPIDHDHAADDSSDGLLLSGGLQSIRNKAVQQEKKMP